MTLEDSTTYQLILSRGEAKGAARGMTLGQLANAQSMIMRLGAKRFGKAAESVEARIRNNTDHTHLERIADRLLDAANWDDLLATP
jgi:hypothetical protein